MKRAGNMLTRMRAALPWLVGILIGWSVLTHRLVSLMPRLSPAEAGFVSHLGSWQALAENPMHTPMRAIALTAQMLLERFGPVLTARLPAVLFGGFAITLFVIITHRWYGRRSAAFAFALSLCAAYVLHVSRFAGYDSEYLASILSILGLHVLLNDHEDKPWAWFVWLLGNLLLVTVPGMVWLVLVSVSWQWRACATAVRHAAAWQRVLSLILAAGTLAWLAFSMVRHHSLLAMWLGLPKLAVSAIQHLPQDLLSTMAALFVHGPAAPDRWLAGMPIFDLFLLAMLVPGLIFYARHPEAKRTRLLASLTLVGILLASLGVVSLAVMVPLLYIVIVGGMAYGLHFWLRLFPLNPLGRSIGISLLAGLVLLSCLLNIRAYFVAWPQNPAVRQAYRLER